MQGAQVTQNGNTNSIGSLGFKEIEQKNVPKANTMTSAKDMSTAEISKMLKVNIAVLCSGRKAAKSK